MSQDQGLYPLFSTQFSANLELKLQQKRSKLRGTVSEGTHVGKQASPVNQLDAVAFKTPAGRGSPMSPVNTTFTRRWVFPTDRELPLQIDTFDELKTIVDPKGQYVEASAAGASRAYDDELILQATAQNQTGQDAGSLTGENFDTTKFQIASDFDDGSTSIGLTVKKMIEAKRILRHYHALDNGEEVTWVMGSQQEADLLQQVQVTSNEFAVKYGGKMDNDGNLSRFLGFNIVLSERLPTITDKNSHANCRGNLVYVKSGLYLGMWRDLSTRISIRNDISSEPFQVYSKISFGGTRTQPGKLLQVACLDTTGTDITV